MKQVYWWFRVVLLSMRWIPRYNIGDRVLHDGREWMLIQGVCQPRWDLIAGKERKDFVHESEFRKVRTLRNYWASFTSGYRFYMGYWFNIWVSNGIEPWMRSCRIWANEPTRL